MNASNSTATSSRYTARAEAKLLALMDAESETQTLIGGTHRRISELRHSLNLNPHSERAADIEHEIARLNGKVADLQQRFAQRSAIAARVKGWLEQGGPNRPLVDAELPQPKLKPGETVIDAVKLVRESIAALYSEQRAILQCGLPKDEIKAQARKFVTEMGMKARPNIRAEHSGFAVSFASTSFSHNIAAQDILCWLDPELMMQRLEDEIDALPESKLALTPLEKQTRLNAVAVPLLELERVEEALIEAAAADGIDIPRRSNADPAAVLGVTVQRPHK